MTAKKRFGLVIGGTAALCLLVAAFGAPRHIRGHWVHRRIEWYGVGLGPLFVYPGEIDYVYRTSSGEAIRHGPYRRYVLQSGKIRLASEGFFDNGVQDGTFTQWNTYDGTKTAETFYVEGKQMGDAWYQQGRLFQYRLDLYDGNKKIATKTFANGKWFLDKVAACLNFSINPQTGEIYPLKEVTCP